MDNPDIRAREGRVAVKLALRRIQPARVIAWSLWRRAHQAEARLAYIKQAKLNQKPQL